MDWNSKAPSSWDLSVGDEEATLPNIETTVDNDDDESTRFGVYRTNKGEFSVDLKLGHVGNYYHSGGSDHIVPNNKSKDFAAASAAGVSKIASSSSSSSSLSSSPSGPFKRARATNNGTLSVSCLVDGCNSDLSTCRDYHRRHKVCEQHSKTPEVTIGGLKQRFCQQCSRFHSLEQFDEGKRSCRKRLDGHNRRRRKPQPEPVTRPAGSFLSNYQGGRQLLPFSSTPNAYSSTAMVMSPAWSGGPIQNHHHQHQLHNLVDKQQDLFLGSSPSSYNNKEENKQQLAASLHNNATTIFNNQNPLSLESSDHHHMVMRTTNNKMFCDNSRLVAANSVHNDVVVPPRALSLLSSSASSSQTHTTTLHNGLSHQMVPHTMCLMQPLGLSLIHDDDDNGGNNFESAVERVLLVPNNNNNGSGDHCCSSSVVYDNNIGGGGSDGSQGNNEAPHQFFPFQWE